VTANAFLAIVSLVGAAACGTAGRRSGSGGIAGCPADGISFALGDRETVLARGALGLDYFPDQATVRLPGTPDLALLVAATTSTYRLTGTDLLHLTGAARVLGPGAPGAFDNGYAGIGGVYRDGAGTLYGFYHAEDQEGLPNIPGTRIPGFYASIGLATSRDAGSTWQKQGPVITSQKPKAWTAYDGQADRGAAAPGVVLDAGGRYLYLFYEDHSRVNGRGVQIFVARADLTAGPPAPGRFSKYYDGAFSEPGIGGLDSVIISGKAYDHADAMFPHPVRSAYLGLFVMIFNVDVWREWQSGRPAARSGFYLAYSCDLVNWSTPALLFVDNTVPVNGRSLSWQGSLLWDDPAEKSGWLVYGYSQRWPESHHMVARRLSFERRGQ
jgi:hypothetical protein